jgi:thiol-disulfide isomerase/thioredoxin
LTCEVGDNGRMRSPRVGLLIASVALAAGIAVAAARCGGSGRPAATTLPSSPTALPRLDPSTFRAALASLRGKPLVLNVWASWCGPCIKEAPGLADLARAYRGRVHFVGIDSLETTVQAGRAFVRRYGWIYPSVFDPDGSLERALGYIGQPVTVVLGADGSKQKVFAGPVETAALRSEIERALVPRSATSP